MNKWLFAILTVSFLLAGCDPLVTYSFQLQNDSSQPIRVEYLVDNVDTAFVVPQGQGALLYKNEQINRRAEDYYLDSLWLFYKLVIEQNDSVPATIVLKDRKEWEFEEKTKVEGEYLLRLEDQDFR